tara:strand:+ start:503 stop:628 length:126 start_codon:yes stop_codon:yes gene_type:complete
MLKFGANNDIIKKNINMIEKANNFKDKQWYKKICQPIARKT